MKYKENQKVIHMELGVGLFKSYDVYFNNAIVEFNNENHKNEDVSVDVAMLKELGSEEKIINRLKDEYNVVISEEMSLIEMSDLMDDVGFSFYYVSYRDLDILDCAKEEGFNDVEIYEIKDGYIGFLKGLI